MNTAHYQENIVNETQNRMIAIAEKIQQPVSTRYDDIYHPRTDKKVIRKSITLDSTNFLIYRRKSVYVSG